MNPPKVTDEDYINFIIATPRDVTATEAERVQPESKNAPAHDANCYVQLFCFNRFYAQKP